MTIKGLLDEDFVQYKKASMTIMFPSCSFKCEKESGEQVCQNGALVQSPDIDIDNSVLIKRYLSNPLTDAIVCSGLEPLDSWDDLYHMIAQLRKLTDDDIVIYTGYKKEEILSKINILSQYKNIYVKFGRFIPGHNRHYDGVLGIYLASDNQYAEKIS